MDWLAFLAFYQSKNPPPVIKSVLNLTRIIEKQDTKCIIGCDNLGMKNYLDGKRHLIEPFLHEFTSGKETLVFEVFKKKKTRKGKEETLPLIEFQNNKEDRLRKTGLQSRFTFENFAVSATNHIAHAAAMAVAENLGKSYNPLFLYGDVGVGKTHLSQAVANKVFEDNLKKKILFCSSEQFTNDLVEFIREKNTKEFRKKYRNTDILIIDDIQFIAGKTYVQEEFYHTFNTLIHEGGQIILTSDRPPKEIKELEDRLRSRFAGGLIIDIQKPDFELRTAIVLIKARERNIDIDINAAKHIAEKIMDSRELEGALLRLLSQKLISENSNSISFKETTEQLKKDEDYLKTKLGPGDIIKAVGLYYNIRPSEIKGPSRKEDVAHARQVCMYFIRSLLGLNFDEIAFILKKKDHTTIMHGNNKITYKTLHDEGFKNEMNVISQSIYSST